MNTNVIEIKKKLAPIKKWLSDEALQSIYSSDFWNDVEVEKKKESWIADGNYRRYLDYLNRVGLMSEWSIVEKYISDLPGLTKLKIADLASGAGWTSALLSKHDKISEVHATEISSHRLAELFPYAIDMFGGSPEKIKRYIGSFYELKFENESMDIIFMSQAFHHADQPLKLLVEIDRVVRKKGNIILLGENYIGKYAQAKCILKRLIKEGQFSKNFYENFPPNNVTGDHYYRLDDYYLLFNMLGYKVRHNIINKTSIVLIASKG